MESTANLHQLQDQLLVPPLPPSSSPSSSSTIVPSFLDHGWTPNISLNNNNSCNYNTRVLNGLSSSFPVRSDCGVKNTNSSMLLQDLGFQWNGVSSSGSFFSQFLHAGGKIKEEMLNSPSTNQDFHPFPSTNHVKNNDSDLNDPSHKLFIKTLINGGDHTEPGEFFNKIYPSINVSDWNLSSPPPPPPPPFSNSLDLNLQTPPDLFHSQDSFGIFKQTLSDFHDQIHPPPSAAILPCISSKVTTPFSPELTEPKRPCTCIEPTLNQPSPPPPPLKKSRLDSRASCPPFKVRKEKLGDRIAALQQLVAPFGKTDTASVLMEAIGYIKFLQNQVETLSVPYMKPSCNKTTGPTYRSPVEGGHEGQLDRDLRSRGLCLVPLGCLSYVAGDGGGIWTPPGFNGGTSR
ncbi:transcription factor bHLH110-like isoform X2 [Cucurbita pepo subsp. pepo]|uniref:transcription factor bHLH110-like isoform X2 n=1 Tax=Cucurbita pepo subsp. pepo TaxID=3664 RepID=UPI000C9D68A1|nr:transcription factor bHLH110-like isoform X2 [Cucurbita pepo subsp. pepo]